MATSEITFANIRPYVTLNLFRGPDCAATAKQVFDKLEGLAGTLPVAPTHPFQDHRHIVPMTRAVAEGITNYGAWYTVEKPPTWLREDSSPGSTGSSGTARLLDVANHLVVVMVYQKYLGVYASHDAMRSRLVELIEVGEAGEGRATVRIDTPAETVTRDEIEFAFVRGNTKSAWLEGLHVPTVLKADRKILSGPDLRYALDHFGEQTFTYTAAISEFGQRNLQVAASKKSAPHRVGVSHSKKTLWTRSTKAFDEFIVEFKTLIALLTNPTAIAVNVSDLERPGVPFVARPVTTQTLTELSDGFDIGYEAPTTPELELLAGEALDRTLNTDPWSQQGRFVVEGATRRSAAPDSEIAAEAYYGDQRVATVSFRPIRRTDQTVDILHRVDSYGVRKDDPAVVALDRSLAKRNTNLTLRYGSGHVIQNGVLYTLHFRDVIFDRWHWTSFPAAPDGKPYKLTDEKPTTGKGKKKIYVPDRIGKEHSLFCYVRNNAANLISPDDRPSGDWWLLCDDGAGEIADFIALDTKRLFVTFVHVKAWKDGKESTISVTPYSEVIAQAIKNLRSFDQNVLGKAIHDRTTDANSELVWRADGVMIDRKKFAAKLDEFRHGAQRHVLILQPRTHRKAWEKAVHAHRSAQDAAQVGRMRQLSALLSGAESIFQKLGATMAVMGVDDQAAAASAASSSSTSSITPSRVRKRRP
ncbi:hypothetical protein M2226_003644 [Bradyrhizobium elkanii]|uniref:hypothetical protein n=1 Tax=Bradyrhizobium elkanii TaxID=29448 RepID=UPI002225C0E4|nr:hypothetical protein [Bradyrhizobium elkanii]MCW2124900.1 hypothetical protein [Bradyrhizobium elkanii]MCW2171646.1 hypothetical protein [Bradyrhizobium elkanii]